MSGPAFVVAISAQPGGGKSTAARCLVDRFAGATIVSYDLFQSVTRLSVAELAAWEEAGADCNAFDLTALERELERRRHSGASLVVFETPLGRSHRGTGRLIDCLVWLDTPYDIALARAVGKIVDDAAREGVAARDMQRWLGSYLATYRDLLWRLYRRQSDEIRPRADLVIPGTEPPRAIAEAIVAHLRRLGLPSAIEGHAGVEG